MRSCLRLVSMLSLLLTLAPLAALAEDKLIAVLELKNKLKGKEKEEIDAEYLADVVRTGALDAAPGVKVMTRENMLVLLASTGKKLEECEGECEVDTGRRLGADVVVSGELLKFGTSYKLNLRMHQTSDGRLLAGAQASGKSADELDQATNAAVRKLLSALAPAPKPAIAQSAITPTPVAPAPSAPAPAPEITRTFAPAAAPASSDPLSPPPSTHPELLDASHTGVQPDAALLQSALHPASGDNTAQYAIKTCLADAKDCFSLASGYQNASFQLPQDRARAETLFLHGCNAGDLNACVMAVNFEWQGLAGPKNLPLARQLARHACRIGSASACNILQWSLDADEEERNLALANQEQLCVKGLPEACFYVGSRHEVAAWKSYARGRIHALCDGGNSMACSYGKSDMLQ